MISLKKHATFYWKTRWWKGFFLLLFRKALLKENNYLKALKSLWSKKIMSWFWPTKKLNNILSEVNTVDKEIRYSGNLKNYWIYQNLYELDPENKSYQLKLAEYIELNDLERAKEFASNCLDTEFLAKSKNPK